jgi:cytochrome c biogenesis protein ResB
MSSTKAGPTSVLALLASSLMACLISSFLAIVCSARRIERTRSAGSEARCERNGPHRR